MRLSKEALLAGCDRQFKEVEISGGTVLVRSLSAGEQLALEQAVRTGHEAGDLRGVMVAQLSAYVSDDAGVQLFSLDEADRLMSRKPQDVTAIVSAGQELNRWTAAEKEAVRGN